MNRAWGWILVGGILETCWAIGMKMADGFSDLPWTAFTLVFIALSVMALNRGLKSGIPTGMCYAVWVGIGAVGSIAVGLVAFGETLSALGWLFLAVIVTGIVGLNYVGESSEEGPGE